MNTIPLPVDIDQMNIANPAFLRLVEEMNKKHISYTLQRGNKPVAILLPVEKNVQEETSDFTFGDNVIDLNQDLDTATVREILSQPSDISALLEMSGSINDNDKNVSSNKKQYIY